jgi:ADP-heptose:LPS heptosyltransferase
MKILVIRFSSIGDIVLTSPVVRCLKKQLPDSEIHFLTRESYKDIIAFNPYIDHIHYLKEDLNSVIMELKKEHFDYVVDLHNNLRTLRIKLELRVKGDSVNKINFEKWLYVNFKWNIMPVAHIVDRYMNTVRSLGVLNDEKGLDYFISSNDEIKIEDLPLTHMHGYIAIAIGAQHATKKLPIEKLKHLISLLHFPIIILGGNEDTIIGEELHLLDKYKVINACGKFSINQSASIVKNAKLVITHDTGLMHIAAAFKKKTISIWGNTVPEFGMTPYYGNEKLEQSNSRIVEIENLSCRPCSKIGFQKCPKKHFKCMNEIDLEKIVALTSNF